MKNMFKLFVIAFLATTMFATAQPSGLSISLGGGISRGINESKNEERNLGLLLGGSVLWDNGLGNGLTPELGLYYHNNGTQDEISAFHYKTSYFSADLRLRWGFITLDNFSPYLFGGLGLSTFNVESQDKFYDPTRERAKEDNGIGMTFPVGIGFKYNFNPKWALDLNGGAYLSLTDDFNPPYDDINDGMWFVKLGINYQFLTFIQDSDGDGLSDKDELLLGTDPNNPDSDGDGLLDGEEVNEYKTDPLDPDTDDGGINDGIEVRNGANPLDADDDILSIAPSEKLILRNIEFVTGKADITPRSERILNNALKAMNKIPTMSFDIVGHTDDVGGAEMNLQLSIDRANSVKAWLVNHGINPDRLTTRGMGMNEPLVPNTNDENRQKNRRVEFYRSN